MTRSAARGLTLIEMLVVSGILLLLVGIVAAVLKPGLVAWRRGGLRSDLQRNALLAIHSIDRAISASSSKSVRIFPAERVDSESGQRRRADAFALLSPLDADRGGVTGDRGTVWRSIIVFYVKDVKAGQSELWTASFDLPQGGRSEAPHTVTDDLKSAGLLPVPVVHALLDDGEEPADLGRNHRVSEAVRSLQVEESHGIFVVTVETGIGDVRCRLESACAPTLERFGGKPSQMSSRTVGTR